MTNEQLIILFGVGVPCSASIAFILWLWKPSRVRKALNPIIPAPSPPPIDDMVLAVIRSLNTEPERWMHRAGSLYRDDFVSFSILLRDSVWIYEDYTKINAVGGDNCRVEISGKQNAQALREAERLAIIKIEARNGAPNMSALRTSLRGKLGI